MRAIFFALKRKDFNDCRQIKTNEAFCVIVVMKHYFALEDILKQMLHLLY